jgi:hypothetical protein
MDQDFYHYYRVESLARTVPSMHKPDKGTDRYVHIVAFNDAEDHELTIRNYLQYHCRVDPDSHDSNVRGLKTDHYICADAILTHYLGAKTNRIIEIAMTPTPIYDDNPTGEPIFKNDTSAIWLVSREENVPDPFRPSAG